MDICSVVIDKESNLLTRVAFSLRMELPELCQLAGQSINDKDFRNSLERFLSLHPQAESNPGKQIRLLINYDGTNIHELSTGQDMPIQTLSVLHQFLIGQLENTDLATDLFIDFFIQSGDPAFGTAFYPLWRGEGHFGGIQSFEEIE